MQIIHIQPPQPCIVCAKAASVALMSDMPNGHQGHHMFPICNVCATTLYDQEALSVTELPDDPLLDRAIEAYKNGHASIRTLASALGVTSHRAGLLLATIRV
jgi:hypothetical protein